MIKNHKNNLSSKTRNYGTGGHPAGRPLPITRAQAEAVRDFVVSPKAIAWPEKIAPRDDYDNFNNLAATRAQVFNDMQTMLDKADAAGGMLASDQRAYDDKEAILDALAEALDRGRPEPVHISEPPAGGEYAKERPLTAAQSFAGYVQSREVGPQLDSYYDSDDLDFGKYMRGALTGNWSGAERELELSNAMSGSTLPAGGILVPTLISSQIIDLARKKTRVLEAGARLVPMESRRVDVAKWTQDPTMGWRAEDAVIAESDAALGKITLEARALATVVRVSRELVEDTDISEELTAAFAAALAQTIDAAALYGAGGDAPTGIKSHANVVKTPLGASGAALTSWDPLVDSLGRLRDANEEPRFQILADRTARSLAKLKATGSGEYLAPPTYLDGVARLTTSGVPTNLTVGSNSDCSDIFTADWSQLYIGVRTELQITLLNERYMTTDGAETPSGGQYGFVAWWRGDIQVARPAAFDVITGVRP